MAFQLLPLEFSMKNILIGFGYIALWCGLVVFVAFLMTRYIHDPVHKKLKKVKDDEDKLPVVLQNELHYVEYLEWVAKKRIVPHFEKRYRF